MQHVLRALAVITFATLMGCGGSESQFEGETLAFSGDFPISRTKDVDAGDHGGVADWYLVTGVTAGTRYRVHLGLPNSAKPDVLSFTVEKNWEDFGQENQYCRGSGSHEEGGDEPSCSFVAEGDSFYLYVLPEFVEDGVETVDYTLSITAE